MRKDQPCSSQNSSEDEEKMSNYMKGMITVRDELFGDAKKEIEMAQLRQKNDYDRKHKRKKVNKYCKL